MDKCFADVSKDILGPGGKKGCTALRIKNCTGCNFFKTLEQKAKDDERTRQRLKHLENKCINILF